MTTFKLPICDHLYKNAHSFVALCACDVEDQFCGRLLSDLLATLGKGCLHPALGLTPATPSSARQQGLQQDSSTPRGNLCELAHGLHLRYRLCQMGSHYMATHFFSQPLPFVNKVSTPYFRSFNICAKKGNKMTQLQDCALSCGRKTRHPLLNVLSHIDFFNAT